MVNKVTNKCYNVWELWELEWHFYRDIERQTKI